MSPFSVSLVLLAAILHAGWNALVKAADDRAGILAAVSAVHALTGLALILAAPAPAPESWPMIATSVTLHYGYYLLLFRSYALGDLSQVYPISRGLAPALVALSAVVLIGETMPPAGWLGICLVSLGVGLLAFRRGTVRAPRGAVAFAVCLGMLISAYSVADGIGVRNSGSLFGYIGWLFLLEFPVPLTVALMRHRGGGVIAPEVLLLGAAGGLFAVTAYGIVLYVKTISPLGAVSAVRESSVIFAALIGICVFRERPVADRLIAATVVAAGVITIALA